MNNIHATLLHIQQMFRLSFKHSGVVAYDKASEEFNNPGWYNTTWVSDIYRKAHINVIDALDTKGLWMMHCCIYPHFHNNSPIFGLVTVFP